MGFKVGDTVKIVGIRDNFNDSFSRFIGEVMKITRVLTDEGYYLDRSESPEDIWYDEELELVKNYTKNMGILKKLTTRLDRLLNPDLKNIYRVGWVDGDLKITKEGQEALLELLLDKHEKELGKLAGKEISRLKKNKKYED